MHLCYMLVSKYMPQLAATKIWRHHTGVRQLLPIFQKDSTINYLYSNNWFILWEISNSSSNQHIIPTILLVVVVKNPRTKVARRGPARDAITELASWSIPSRLDARTANPILMTPIKVAIDLVMTSCLFWRMILSALPWVPYECVAKCLPPKPTLSALLTSEFAMPKATKTSSQTTAAREFNPDDRVLK